MEKADIINILFAILRNLLPIVLLPFILSVSLRLVKRLFLGSPEFRERRMLQKLPDVVVTETDQETPAKLTLEERLARADEIADEYWWHPWDMPTPTYGDQDDS